MCWNRPERPWPECMGGSTITRLSLAREKGRRLCARSQDSRYSISDLFDLIFPPDRGINGCMCMVFNAFLDDSGHKPKKLMVSAGFCGNKHNWENFRRDWRKALVLHGLDYFKSSECNHVDGQFRKLRKGEYATPEEKQEAR